MGVDYTANYGIGFGVTEPSSEVLEQYDDSFEEYLESELDYPDCRYFCEGSEYSRNAKDFYVVLKNDTLDEGLFERCENLKNFLVEKGLVSDDAKASVVGGLLIW